MRKLDVACLIAILILSAALPVNAQVTSTSTTTVDETLFITYNFENLDQAVYTQALTEVKADTIPSQITQFLGQQGKTLVSWGFSPQPLVFNNETRSIRASFFLGGSDVISSSLNRTSMKRTYQVKTEWTRFRLELTSSYTINFALYVTKQVAEWQKTNATTFYFENKQTGLLEVFSYIKLPASASQVQAVGDVISYEMPPRFDDLLLGSPFLILIALAVVFIIIILYRKAR